MTTGIDSILGRSAYNRRGGVSSSFTLMSLGLRDLIKLLMLQSIFTARCYADRGIATASRLPVLLSVTLRSHRLELGIPIPGPFSQSRDSGLEYF